MSSAPIFQSMLAYRFPSPGNTSTSSLPTPPLESDIEANRTLNPGADEVLIRINPTSLPASQLFCTTERPASSHNQTPSTLEPIVGTIVSIDTASTSTPSSLKPGDEVYTLIDPSITKKSNEGAYILLPTASISSIPSSVCSEEAANIPLPALTAWQALFLHAGIPLPPSSTGEEADPDAITKTTRVLVVGGAAGIGAWTVQLAKAAGCQVVATCGPGNCGFVKSMGADETVDITKTSLKDWVRQDPSRKGNVIVDCLGGELLEEAWLCAADGGMVMSVVQPSETRRPLEGVKRCVRSMWFNVKPDGEQLRAVSRWIEEGRCKPVVEGLSDLDEGAFLTSHNLDEQRRFSTFFMNYAPVPDAADRKKALSQVALNHKARKRLSLRERRTAP